LSGIFSAAGEVNELDLLPAFHFNSGNEVL